MGSGTTKLASTGKSHLLIGCGHAAVHAGFKVSYFTAADHIETLYRGMADNTELTNYPHRSGTFPATAL